LDGKENYSSNAKEKNSILCGLTNTKFFKVTHCKYVKETWDKLQSIYKGDEKVKITKVQIHKGKFKSSNMDEDENIATFFLCVDNIVNTIKGIGETIEESLIVQELLRSLP